MVLCCPHCGARDHTEFTYGREANPRPAEETAGLEQWIDYAFLRDNQRGAHVEYWQHTAGCRAWLLVRRDTLTHAVFAVELAGEGAPT